MLKFLYILGVICYCVFELGEYNEEILGGKLGLLSEDLVVLKEKGVI